MIQVRTVDGTLVHLPDEEAHRIHREMTERGSSEHKLSAKTVYAGKTRELMLEAQEELRELTGDYPENLKELYEFAVKHRLFGGREDAHLMCNFLKVMYALLQEKTHA